MSKSSESEEDRTQAPTQAGPEYTGIGSSPRTAREAGRFTPGSIVADRFRIVAPLGRGGMGEVYRAEDLRLGQTVALKFLPEQLAHHPGPLERLRAEVRVGRQIAHPTVCRIYDLIEADGQRFVAMEYVDGEDLASLLRRIGRLPPDKAIELAHQICAGLAAIHEQDILHRDLKPANIMIDGRGRARITDFGLAVPRRELDPDELSGTPAYMAPEQLTGGGASAKTDLYALGLVLYEMFCGNRPFAAESMEELAARQRDSPPPSPESSSPSLDQIVLRCLDPDPEQRPPSARGVLAALPGGDPLERAVADGETPSPEMVAAAGVVGDLRPAVAWALLAAVLVCLVSLAGFADRTSNLKRVGLPKPPAALIEDARRVLAIVGGHVTSPLDQAHGFYWSRERTAMRDVHGVEAADRLHPGPIRFFYRQRPGPLVPLAGKFSLTIFLPGYSDLGLVLRDDPPMTLPGEAEVVLDPAGRLVGLKVVAPPLASPGEQDEPSSQTWSDLLIRAGFFEPASLKSTQPLWTPPVASDVRFAWLGEYPDQPEVLLRIEAAAFAGHPVWLRVLGPWVEPQQAPSGRPWFVGLVEALMVVYVILILLGGLALVRRNLLLGRGDRRGALRLALFVFTTFSVGGLFRVNHLSSAAAEYDLLVTLAAHSTFMALMAWVGYMAIEPFLRRRWPRTLIAWTRVLAGRFRDPIVGRDLLVGLLVGALFVLIFRAEFLLREGVEIAPTTLSSARHVAYYALFYLTPAVVFYSIGSLLTLVLFRSLLRSEKRALLGIWLVSTASCMALLGFGPVPPLLGALLVLVIRFGLLPTAVALYVFSLCAKLPMTLDPSSWYAGRSFAVLLLLAALTVFAFYTSLGGKPLFGRDLFEA